ncbi:VWA domain-containing protein [Radiobacillus kanasensis]|uniref:vWA domain-containing protein n=1 Tax=Radiobacillus kanasensis TaxID=2844358 RepID=UPI001E5CD7F3|nr:VWA domain-containing protein [Radiobacillus kanasensis]UFT99715.1 VWA domain-containing protein [Radiobacillus kanasensis]
MKAWKLLVMIVCLLVFAACENSTQSSSKKQTNDQETGEKQTKENKDDEETTTALQADASFQYPSSLKEAEEAVTGEWWGEDNEPSDSEEETFTQEISAISNQESSLETRAAAINHLLFTHYHPELPGLTSFLPRGKITLEDLQNGSGLKLNGREVKENINVAIILDASGSMKAEQNGKSQMEIAKDAIKEFVSNLPEKTNVSLTIYGYKGSGSDADKELSCKSIKEIYPLKKYNNGEFDKALASVDPKGWTPIASALKQAGKTLEDLKSDANTNVIYLVSDGEETCDGDPAQVAEDLVSTDIKPIINVIGFAVGSEQRKQLEKVAEAAEGRYIQANNQQELVSEFKKSNQTLVQWINWRNQHTVDAINQKNQDNVDLINLKNDTNVRLINYKNKVNNLLIKAKNQHDMDQEVFNLTIEHLEEYFSRIVKELQNDFDEKLTIIETTYNETKEEIDETYDSNKEE